MITRRTPLDLAIDAGTVIGVATVAWGELWALLIGGWPAGVGIGVIAATIVATERVLRTVLRSLSRRRPAPARTP